MALQLRTQAHLLEFVGEEIFDTFEAGLGSQGKTVEERRLGKQHCQVRSELRHAVFPPYDCY
ncbi:hypothetical protein D3C87_2029800 [compost metagenome]